MDFFFPFFPGRRTGISLLEEDPMFFSKISRQGLAFSPPYGADFFSPSPQRS